MTRPQLKACGVLVVRGTPIEEFLLMVHADRWDLPKGHLDAGESEQECALRELHEETGIRADDVQLDPDFRFATHYEVRPAFMNYQPCDKTTVIFLGRLVRDVPVQVTEHQGYRWLRWAPPHAIQAETIDPLLQQLEQFLV